jgi:hypothetical protein
MRQAIEKIRARRGVSTSASVYSVATRNRLRAIVDDVLELFERERTSGKRDHIAALADAYHENPLDWMERVGKFLGLGDQAAQVQNFTQFNGIFAQAAATAAERAKTIETDGARALDDSQVVEW